MNNGETSENVENVEKTESLENEDNLETGIKDHTGINVVSVEEVGQNGSTNGDEDVSDIEDENEDKGIQENVTSLTQTQESVYDTLLHSVLNRINNRKGIVFTLVWLIRNLILTYALFLAVLFLIIYDVSLTLSTFYTIRKNNRNGWWREFNHNHPLIPEFRFTSTIGSISVLLLMILLSSSVFHRCVQFLIYFVWSKKQYVYVAEILMIKYGFCFSKKCQRENKCGVFVFKVFVQLALWLVIEVFPLPLAIIIAFIAVIQNQDYKSLISMSIFFIAVSLLVTNVIWFLIGTCDNYARLFCCCIGNVGRNIQNTDEEDFFETRVSLVAEQLQSPTTALGDEPYQTFSYDDIQYQRRQQQSSSQEFADEEQDRLIQVLNSQVEQIREEKEQLLSQQQQHRTTNNAAGASEENLIRIVVYFCWYMNPLFFQIHFFWLAILTCLGVVFLFVASVVVLIVSTAWNYNDFFVSFPLVMFNAWWSWFIFCIVIIVIVLVILNIIMNCFIEIPKRDPIKDPLSYQREGIRWYHLHKRIVFGLEEVFYHSPRIVVWALKCLLLADVVVFVTVAFFFTPFRGFITHNSVRDYVRLYIDVLLFCIVLFLNLMCILCCYQCRYNIPKQIREIFQEDNRMRRGENKNVEEIIDNEEEGEEDKIIISTFPDYDSLEEGGETVFDDDDDDDKEEQDDDEEEDEEQNENVIISSYFDEKDSSQKINDDEDDKKEEEEEEEEVKKDVEDNECFFFKYGSIFCLLSSSCFWCCVLFFFVWVSWLAIILWSTTGDKGPLGFFFISYNIFAPMIFPVLVCLLGFGVCDRHRHYQNVIRYGYFAAFVLLLGGVFFVSGLHDFGQPNSLKASDLREDYLKILTQPNPNDGREGRQFSDDRYMLCRQEWSGLDIVDIMFLTELSYKICSEGEELGACGESWMKAFFPDFCLDGFFIVPNFEELYDKNPNERDKAEYEYFFKMYEQMNGTDSCLIRSPRESEDVKFYHIYSSKYKWHVVSIRGTKTLLDYIQDFNLWKEVALLQFVNFFIPILQNFGNRFIRIIVALWDSFNSLLSGNFFSLFLSYDENTVYYHKVENYIAKNILCRNWEERGHGLSRCIESTEKMGEELLYITGHSLGGGLSKIVGMSLVYNYGIGDNINVTSKEQKFFTPIKRVVPFSFAGPGILISSGKFFFSTFVFDYFLKSRTGVFEEKMDSDVINIKPEVDVVSSIDFLTGDIQRVGCPSQNALGCHSSTTILQTLINSCGNKRKGRDIPYKSNAFSSSNMVFNVLIFSSLLIFL